jgi:hypothetical protein
MAVYGERIIVGLLGRSLAHEAAGHVRSALNGLRPRA